MPIVVEASAVAAAETVTIAPAGTDRMMYCIPSHDGAGNTAVVPDAVFNTTEAYSEIAETADVLGQYEALLRADTQPSAVSATLDASPTTGVTITYTLGIALSGVDQTTPHDTPTVSEATATSLSVAITSATDDLVVGALAANNVSAGWATPTGDSPTELQDFGNAGHGGALITCPGAATVNIGASWTGSRRASIIAWNVNVAGGAAGMVPHTPWSQLGPRMAH